MENDAKSEKTNAGSYCAEQKNNYLYKKLLVDEKMICLNSAYFDLIVLT